MRNPFKQLFANADSMSMKGDDKRLLEEFYLSRRLRNCTEQTLRCYAQRLMCLCELACRIDKQVTEVTRRDLQRYLHELLQSPSLKTGKRLSDATIHGRMLVFRVFYGWISAEYPELMPENPTVKLGPIRVEKKIRPVLTGIQVQAILKSLQTGPSDRYRFEKERNALMVMMLYDGMFRISELLGLKVTDIDLVTGVVTVLGKGRRQGLVPISTKTALRLAKFLRIRHDSPSEYLFTKRDGTQLTYFAARLCINRIGKRVGLKLNPHLFRHTGATEWLRQGGDSMFLRKVLRQKSMCVLDSYEHAQIDDTKAAHERFSPVRALG